MEKQEWELQIEQKLSQTGVAYIDLMRCFQMDPEELDAYIREKGREKLPFILEAIDAIYEMKYDG